MAGERSLPAVGREQHADHLVGDLQRHPQDRHQALRPHCGVDAAGVGEALVSEVVGGVVGAGGLHNQPAQPGPGGDAQLLEVR